MDSKSVIDYLVSRYGSADWSNWEAQRWTFWDYARYPSAAGTNALNLFINPLGSVDPTSALPKTLEQTNLVKAGSFGQQYFVALEAKTHLFVVPKVRQPAAIAALTRYTNDGAGASTVFWDSWQDLTNNGVFRLFIQQKEYLTVPTPFLNMPPGFGVDIQHGSATIAGAAITAAAYWGQQSPHRGNVFALTPPLVFEPEVQFNCSIQFPNGLVPMGALAANVVALDIGVLFDGYVIRPKQ